MGNRNPIERLESSLYIAQEKVAIGVFTSLTVTSAREEAKRALDRLNAGALLGPLDGCLVAIKANIDLAKLENTAGSVAFSPVPANRDAELVTRLRGAGAIILGHTNMSEFAFSGLGMNPHFGTPTNPLSADAPLVPGGSSSGSASAVSLGIADMAIGTDTSGSIRVPAAFQGLVGYRPSMGRYSSDGVFPLAVSLDTPGSISKTVAQIIALDGVLAENPIPNKVDISEMFFVAPTYSFLKEADVFIQSWFENTISYLGAMGARIERRDLAVLRKTQELFAIHGTLVAIEAREVIPHYVDPNNDEIDIRVRKRLAASSFISADDIRTLYDSKKVFEEEIEKELGEAVLLIPTTPNEPPTLAETADNDDFSIINARTLSYTMLGAYLNMPTVALPVDRVTPGASLSIACIHGADDKVLAVAQEIEKAFELWVDPL